MEFWQLLALDECRNSRYAENVGLSAMVDVKLTIAGFWDDDVPKLMSLNKVPSNVKSR